MVSQTQTEMSGETLVRNRGFIPEETVVAAGPDNSRVTYYRPFWRPVLAGALFALSAFVLSWYLMLGCHVGVDTSGLLALGAGAAVWLWVTACVAYFFGGMIANAMTATPGGTSMSDGSAWLKGAVIWAFSIPLALVVYGLLAQQTGILAALDLPHSGIAHSATTGAHLGFYWAAFIGLGCALIFSIVGSFAGCACRERFR